MQSVEVDEVGLEDIELPQPAMNRWGSSGIDRRGEIPAARQERRAEEQSMQDLKNRKDIDARWRQVLEEERRLQELEAAVVNREHHANLESEHVAPNFPPKFLCFSPQVHHDILADIPATRQLQVRVAFYMWIATSVLLGLNFIVCLALLLIPLPPGASSPYSANVMAQHIGLSAAFVLGVPISFILWYWQIYQSAATGRKTRHIVALMGLSIALAYCVFAIIGIVGLGTCGAIFIHYVSSTRGAGAGAPAIVVTVLVGVQIPGFIYLLYWQKKWYNADGQILEASQSQAAQYRQVALGTPSVKPDGA